MLMNFDRTSDRLTFVFFGLTVFSLGLFKLFYGLLAKLLDRIHFLLICCLFVFLLLFMNFSILFVSVGFSHFFSSGGLT